MKAVVKAVVEGRILPPAAGVGLGTMTSRLLLFTFFWWVLVEGDLRHAWLGGVFVVIAVALSYAFWPVGSWRWKLTQLPRFLPFFIRESFLGGLDIARRAFSPSLPLQSRLLSYRMRLPGGAPRAFLAWVIGLVPGTASVHLHEESLQIHIIGDPSEAEVRLREVEARVARLFGVEVGPPGADGTGAPGSISEVRSTQPQNEEPKEGTTTAH